MCKGKYVKNITNFRWMMGAKMDNMGWMLKEDTKSCIGKARVKSRWWFMDMIGWINDCIGDTQGECLVILGKKIIARITETSTLWYGQGWFQ